MSLLRLLTYTKTLILLMPIPIYKKDVKKLDLNNRENLIKKNKKFEMKNLKNKKSKISERGRAYINILNGGYGPG